MFRLKRSFLFLLLTVAALAQTESQIESDEVKRVGTHIGCQCGSCQEDVNCNMSSGQCHFCKPTRTKIYQMQKSGMSDSGIIEQFKKMYGDKIYRADPGSFFWLVPYLSLAVGGVVLVLVVRKLRGAGHKPALAGHPIDDDPVLARYREAIERDTES
jgi:cytochrome c-type biogenesis protein CcmH/NrfF